MSTVADGIGHRAACRSGVLATCQIQFSNPVCLPKVRGERLGIRRLCLASALSVFLSTLDVRCSFILFSFPVLVPRVGFFFVSPRGRM